MIKLSIVSTLYKSEPYIRKCLDSLLSQDIPCDEYELVIVDDGSPDKCFEIIEEYQKQYPNIKLIRQENMGLPGARNTGVRNSIGKYITFVDPDDFVNPNVYGGLIKKIERENLDMLRFDYTLTEEETYKKLPKFKESLLTVDYRDEIVDGETFLGKRLGYACYVWQFIFKRSLFVDNNIEFREKVFDDADVLPRVIIKANRVTSIDTKVYNYVLRTGSLVNAVSKPAAIKKIEGCLFIISVYNQYYDECKDQNAKIWFMSMISSTYLAMVQQIAKYDFEDRRMYLDKFRQSNKISFCYSRRRWTKKVHMIAAATVPFLYMMLYKEVY